MSGKILKKNGRFKTMKSSIEPKGTAGSPRYREKTPDNIAVNLYHSMLACMLSYLIMAMKHYTINSLCYADASPRGRSFNPWPSPAPDHARKDQLL